MNEFSNRDHVIVSCLVELALIIGLTVLGVSYSEYKARRFTIGIRKWMIPFVPRRNRRTKRMKDRRALKNIVLRNSRQAGDNGFFNNIRQLDTGGNLNRSKYNTRGFHRLKSAHHASFGKFAGVPLIPGDEESLIGPRFQADSFFASSRDKNVSCNLAVSIVTSNDDQRGKIGHILNGNRTRAFRQIFPIYLLIGLALVR